jgi:sec-independent protein translocase protein TatA
VSLSFCTGVFFGFMGTTEWMIVAGIAVLLFGSSKLPKLAKSLGQSVTEFKKGIKSDDEDEGEGTKSLPRDES